MTEAQNLTVKALFKEAAEEVEDEAIKAAKVKIKSKLKQLKQAKQVVANLERELEDLELEISHELKST